MWVKVKASEPQQTGLPVNGLFIDSVTDKVIIGSVIIRVWYGNGKTKSD